MIRTLTLSSLIFLFIKNVTSVCDNVFSKRLSKEFFILKNKPFFDASINRTIGFKSRDDCFSGVVLQSKFNESYYCVSKNQQNSAKAEKLTCFAKTKQHDCQCGIENPPPSSTNRIMYGTGIRL